jgi:hypothetical protein
MRPACLLLTFSATVFAEGPWSVERLVGLEYPLLAQLANVQGAVDVVCNVGGNGEVIDCNAMSGHPLLQSAAVGNAKR